MAKQSGTFPARDGLQLFWQGWLPDTSPQGTILIVHGAGEHCGRYRYLVEYFQTRGYCLYGFDFRGHGRSEGVRGDVLDWEQYRDDVHSFISWVLSREPTEPLYLFGHSMGGQIVLDYLTMERHEDEAVHHASIASVITSGAAIAQPRINPVLVLIGKLLSLVMPTFSLSNGLNTDLISRDPQEVKAYREDPLVASKFTARWASGFLRAILRVQSNAHRQRLPIFMYHGGADQIIPAIASRQYFSKLGMADKTLTIYDGGYHEPHNDLQKQEVFSDIERWLTR